jgi:hypothetical protein
MQRKVDRSLLTGAAGLGVLAAVWMLPGIPSANQQRDVQVRPALAAEAGDGVRIEPAEKKPEATAAGPSFDRYRRLLEQNPFSPRLPKKLTVPPLPLIGPPAPPVLPSADKQPEVKKPDAAPVAAPPKAPEAPDPLKDWVYSGTVAIGDDVYAVLENKASKQGRYLKRGDNLEGATIEGIAQDELSVTLNGAPRTLAKSTAFGATPLSAAGGGGTPPAPSGATAPGQPGGPPPGAPMPPGARPAGVPAGMNIERRSGPSPTGVSAPVAVPVPVLK